MHFNYPTDICFTCSKCGICCGDTKHKTRHILLLQSDAEKIAAHTKQQIKEFAAPTPKKTPYIHEMKKNHLDGKCIFLNINQCTIYKHRPLICRFYPFELTTMETGDYTIRFTQECPGISKKDQNQATTLREAFFKKLLKLASGKLGNKP